MSQKLQIPSTRVTRSGWRIQAARNGCTLPCSNGHVAKTLLTFLLSPIKTMSVTLQVTMFKCLKLKVSSGFFL